MASTTSQTDTIHGPFRPQKAAAGVPDPLPTPPPVFRNFINGDWRESQSDRTVPNLNPADTRQILGNVPQSTVEEANAAVMAAHKALAGWRNTPAPMRARPLFKLLELIENNRDELAAICALEEGKTFGESRGEVMKSENVIEYFAGEGRRIAGETLPSEMPKTFCYTLRQPLGVVSLITPWNFPYAIPCWKMAPALICGNTVIWKPATLTPWTAYRLTELIAEAGFPPGVVNTVFGSGGTVGNALLEHPAVDGVSFTGSNEVGCEVYANGAKRLLKVQCEMGGKNPLVVLEDADIDLAAAATAQGAFGSTGQRCTATSRAIVVDSAADQFVAKVVSLARDIRVGNPLGEGVTMGPSVDQGQFNTVMEYIGIGENEGAKHEIGGRKLETDEWANGYYSTPCVFDHVSANSRIAQEEIFGPVLSIIRVANFDEALQVANNVQFGLSSSLYSTDSNRIFRFIDDIETGIVHINSPTVGGEAQLPFGGMKGTGVGSREQGKTALEFFTEVKTTYIDYTGVKRETNIY
jgi:aldehyde dehydrogenase (NAD+)